MCSKGNPTCADGIAACDSHADASDHCNGYGTVSRAGRRYRKRSGGQNITATAVPHLACLGAGVRLCGCEPLTPERTRALRDAQWEGLRTIEARQNGTAATAA